MESALDSDAGNVVEPATLCLEGRCSVRISRGLVISAHQVNIFHNLLLITLYPLLLVITLRKSHPFEALCTRQVSIRRLIGKNQSSWLPPSCSLLDTYRTVVSAPTSTTVRSSFTPTAFLLSTTRLYPAHSGRPRFSSDIFPPGQIAFSASAFAVIRIRE